jgi:hypothetical protein
LFRITSTRRSNSQEFANVFPTSASRYFSSAIISVPKPARFAVKGVTGRFRYIHGRRRENTRKAGIKNKKLFLQRCQVWAGSALRSKAGGSGDRKASPPGIIWAFLKFFLFFVTKLTFKCIRYERGDVESPACPKRKISLVENSMKLGVGRFCFAIGGLFCTISTAGWPDEKYE